MKDSKGEHPFGDAGQMLSGILFLIIWIVDSFFLRKSIFLSEYIPFFIRIITLTISIVIAARLFMSGHIVVRNVNRPMNVISDGVFKYVRHPLYLSSLLVYFGLTVATVSLFSFGLLILIFLFYNFIATYEERIMEMKFGDEYRKYKSKTWKWFPKIW